MFNRDDFLQAKQVLGRSLLPAALRGGVVGLRPALRVSDIIANVPRGVHAVGIGRKVVNGRVTEDLSVRVHVVQKVAHSFLPPAYHIPSQIDGIPTDVVESPPAFIAATESQAPTAETAAADVPGCSTDRFQRQRPLIAGISSGHFNVSVGTLGYFCRSTRQGDDPDKVFVLSNNHVYADVNQGHVGDNLLQPGVFDHGTLVDVIATLVRSVPLQLGADGQNRVDAAIGELRPDVTYVAEVCSIGAIIGTAIATDGMQVRKHGRTTGYAEGEVTDLSYDAIVGMDHNNSSVVACFENQIRIQPISPFKAIGVGGDSGSLVVEKGSQSAVGLYFANPMDGSYGVVNSIEDVLSELEIQLL
ncbi:MAG TPA: hypothetical protein VER55_11745 [Ardenticatenaceae bacterium]|nr:hypothetical protein [Ardenticatenaceae bacterium]